MICESCGLKKPSVELHQDPRIEWMSLKWWCFSCWDDLATED
jgi:hypothetical protein